MKIIGIDLGTTNSVVCQYTKGFATVIPIDGKPALPSVVYIDGDQIEVGQKAKSRALIKPDQVLISTKREIGTAWTKKILEKTYTPVDAAWHVLSHIKKEAEAALGDRVEKAVVTIPAYFNDKQREETKKAAERAGLTVLRLLPEPTAAAIAYGMDKERDQSILVFDLGGGTFDVSILEVRQNNFEVKAVDGNSRLGGDDFDGAIVEFLNKWIEEETGKSARGSAIAQQKLKEVAEEAKIALSSGQTTEIYAPAILEGVDVEIDRFTRKQFEQSISPFLDEMVEKTRSVIAQAGLKIDDINRIVLVGGSCKMPVIAETVTTHFKQPFIAEDMDVSVAQGAALVCASLMTLTETEERSLPHELIAKDVIPHSLGIEMMIDEKKRTLRFQPILKKNRHYPGKDACIGYTLNEWQEMVRFNVFRGENEEPAKNAKLGELVFNISRKNIGQGTVAACAIFELDINGILTFTAVEIPINSKTQQDVIELDEIAQRSDNIVPYQKVEEMIDKFNLITKTITLKAV